MKTSCSCGGNDYIYNVGGLFTDSGDFDIDIELLAGAAVGVTAAQMVDPLLDKVKFLSENDMIKQLTKAGAGILATQFGISFLDGVGYGMIGVAAANILKSILPDNLFSETPPPPTVTGVDEYWEQVHNMKMEPEQAKRMMQDYVNNIVDSMKGVDPKTFDAGSMQAYLYGLMTQKETAGSDTSYLYGINKIDSKKLKIKVN